MPSLRASKGKKRALAPISDDDATSLRSLSPPPRAPIRKPKRAETRPCPICEEPIPLRLLGHHAELELSRVDAIVQRIGSVDEDFSYEAEAGPSTSTSTATSTRRSALRARKAINPRSPWATHAGDSLDLADKAIRAIKRRRKTRHGTLRDLAREDDEGLADADGSGGLAGERACPVCLQLVRGDEDVIEAHVDACLAHASQVQEEEEARERERVEREREEVDVDGDGESDGWEEVHVDGEVTLRRTGASGTRGLGFHSRDRNLGDVDDEIDIDGDDQEVFGDAQFWEGDIVASGSAPRAAADAEVLAVDIDGDTDDEREGGSSLRDLVAAGKVVRRHSASPAEGVETVKAKMEEVMGVGDADRLEAAVVVARRARDSKTLIAALENKIAFLETTHVSSSTSSLCRICLDPYAEPTVSTGCWHTCCRECWLRCLGSTKLCPMCKRITQATELRRVYL